MKGHPETGAAEFDLAACDRHSNAKAPVWRRRQEADGHDRSEPEEHVSPTRPTLSALSNVALVKPNPLTRVLWRSVNAGLEASDE